MYSYLGPGLLISIAYLDPGNIAGDIQAGVMGQFDLLWVLLLSTLVGFFFQTYALKLGLYTNKDLPTLCRLHFRRQRSTILWGMTEIAIIGSDIQEVLGSAIALRILFGVPIPYGVVLSIFSAFLILLIKFCGQEKLEMIFAFFLAVMATCFFINLYHIQLSLSDVLKGIFVPKLSASALPAAIGLVGSIIMPHNLHLHSSLILERRGKGYSHQQLIKYHTIETFFTLLMSFVINGALIATFAVFKLRDLGTGEELNLSNAGEALRQNFNSSALIIWGIGLLASGQSSTLTGTLAGQYVMEGFLDLKIDKFTRALLTRAVAIIPATLIAFVDNQENFNHYLNILQAVQLPFTLIPLLRIHADKRIMGQNFMRRKVFRLLSFIGACIVFANYYLIFQIQLGLSIFSLLAVFVLAILYFYFLVILCTEELVIPEQQQLLLGQDEELNCIKMIDIKTVVKNKKQILAAKKPGKSVLARIRASQVVLVQNDQNKQLKSIPKSGNLLQKVDNNIKKPKKFTSSYQNPLQAKKVLNKSQNSTKNGLNLKQIANSNNQTSAVNFKNQQQSVPVTIRTPLQATDCKQLSTTDSQKQ